MFIEQCVFTLIDFLFVTVGFVLFFSSVIFVSYSEHNVLESFDNDTIIVKFQTISPRWIHL